MRITVVQVHILTIIFIHTLTDLVDIGAVALFSDMLLSLERQALKVHPRMTHPYRTKRIRVVLTLR